MIMMVMISLSVGRFNSLAPNCVAARKTVCIPALYQKNEIRNRFSTGVCFTCDHTFFNSRKPLVKTFFFSSLSFTLLMGKRLSDIYPNTSHQMPTRINETRGGIKLRSYQLVKPKVSGKKTTM